VTGARYAVGRGWERWVEGVLRHHRGHFPRSEAKSDQAEHRTSTRSVSHSTTLRQQHGFLCEVSGDRTMSHRSNSWRASAKEEVHDLRKNFKRSSRKGAVSGSTSRDFLCDAGPYSVRIERPDRLRPPWDGKRSVERSGFTNDGPSKRSLRFGAEKRQKSKQIVRKKLPGDYFPD
jgi:hypothetical protein